MFDSRTRSTTREWVTNFFVLFGVEYLAKIVCFYKSSVGEIILIEFCNYLYFFFSKWFFRKIIENNLLMNISF